MVCLVVGADEEVGLLVVPLATGVAGGDGDGDGEGVSMILFFLGKTFLFFLVVLARGLCCRAVHLLLTSSCCFLMGLDDPFSPMD